MLPREANAFEHGARFLGLLHQFERRKPFQARSRFFDFTAEQQVVLLVDRQQQRKPLGAFVAKHQK